MESDLFSETTNQNAFTLLVLPVLVLSTKDGKDLLGLALHRASCRCFTVSKRIAARSRSTIPPAENLSGPLTLEATKPDCISRYTAPRTSALIQLLSEFCILFLFLTIPRRPRIQRIQDQRHLTIDILHAKVVTISISRTH